MDARSPVLQRLITVFYAIMYGGFAGIGLFQIITPSPTVRAEAGFLVYVWAVMLLVGGVLAAVGLVGGWWWPELLGQPLLASPFLLWAVAVGAIESPGRWSFVCLCLVIVARAAGRSVRLIAGVRPKQDDVP